MHQFTYNKSERLKSRKLIEELFTSGQSLLQFPLKVLYKEVNLQNGGLQTGFSVGSKRFKKAVDRNRIKRLMREAFRLQKTLLQQHLHFQNKKLALFFIYIGKDIPAYNDIHKRMGKVLNQLIMQYPHLEV